MSNNWIPCIEKLPENGTCCLVTFENGEMNKSRYTIQFGWSSELPHNRVIAWQPLPRPYKKEE